MRRNCVTLQSTMHCAERPVFWLLLDLGKPRREGNGRKEARAWESACRGVVDRFVTGMRGKRITLRPLAANIYRMSITLGLTFAVMPRVGADFDPLRDAQFTWWDTMKYFYYFLQNEFIDYALVVQISYFMAVLCAVSITVVLILMLRMFFRRHRDKKYYRKIDKRFGEAISTIVSSPTLLTTEEVNELMRNRKRPRRLWRYRQWVKLISERFDEHRSSLAQEDARGIKLAYDNLHRLLDLLNLGPLIERMLREGLNSDRVYLVQIALQFNLMLSEGVILRMANIKNVALSKVVQTYYMWASNENPFRFLDQGGDGVYLKEDGIWLHNSMKRRKIDGRPLPSLLPYVLRAKKPELRALLIREVGYWGSQKDFSKLTDYFTDSHDDVRRAAFEAVSRGGYEPG